MSSLLPPSPSPCPGLDSAKYNCTETACRHQLLPPTTTTHHPHHNSISSRQISESISEPARSQVSQSPEFLMIDGSSSSHYKLITGSLQCSHLALVETREDLVVRLHNLVRVASPQLTSHHISSHPSHLPANPPVCQAAKSPPVFAPHLSSSKVGVRPVASLLNN